MSHILQLLPIEKVFQKVSIVPEGSLVKQPGKKIKSGKYKSWISVSGTSGYQGHVITCNSKILMDREFTFCPQRLSSSSSSPPGPDALMPAPQCMHALNQLWPHLEFSRRTKSISLSTSDTVNIIIAIAGPTTMQCTQNLVCCLN